MTGEHSLIERLAQHCLRVVHADMRTRARLHLLDWLACVAGARRSPVAAVARRGGLDALTTAALLGNGLEMDDVHRSARLHPGPVVWPAALQAIAETGGDMAALLDAGVRGYEAMIGVGATFDAYHYAHWHNTASAGGFGAAAAAGSVHGLSRAQLVDALGNAGSIAGGLWHMRHDDVMTKPLHVSHAAFSGAWCARMAKAGLTGPRAVLEGPQGVYAAMTQTPLPMVLADGWRIAQVSFKPWAACRHAHPAIDCALELRGRGELAPPFVVETYADALVFCDCADPLTEAQARFSLQHAVAVIAAGRDATPADFTPEAIAALAPLRAQVRVAQAPEITARYPAHFGARLHAGAATVELTDTRGDPERPITEADIVAKLRTLVDWGGLAQGEADRAARVVLAGNDAAAVAALLDDWLGA